MSKVIEFPEALTLKDNMVLYVVSPDDDEDKEDRKVSIATLKEAVKQDTVDIKLIKTEW